MAPVDADVLRGGVDDTGGISLSVAAQQVLRSLTDHNVSYMAREERFKFGNYL